MMKSWGTTPSIVIEDVDQMKVTRLDFRRPSIISRDFTPAKIHQTCITPPAEQQSEMSTFKAPLERSPTALIRPQVEAYVAPLSLCSSPKQQTDVLVKEKEPVIVSNHNNNHQPNVTCSEDDGSFTSVDIGGSMIALNPLHYHQSGDQSSCWNSWNDSDMSGHYKSTGDVGCCFDFNIGLKSVTKTVAGCTGNPTATAGGPQDHRVDMSDVGMPVLMPRTPQSGRKKRRAMSKCSTAAVVFLAVVILVLIAVGIAMYIEFVTKPQANRLAQQANETVTICDLLINGCEDGNGTTTTVAPKNPVQNESGRVEATFSSNFTSKLNQQMKSSTS